MADQTGALTLADILMASGVSEINDVVLIRHTLTGESYNEELHTPADVTPANVLAYTRRQGRQAGKLGATPGPIWLVFIADGKTRARFFTAYENRGEVIEEQTDIRRFFDLHESDLLSSLRNRLVIDWGKDAINWAKRGARAETMPVVEIADPTAVPFPGFERVRISYGELQDVVVDSRYAEWRTALRAVKGIYLIADSTGPGRLYVGKADGQDGIFGRWSSYAQTGHGGNVALRALTGLDPKHAANFTFSILRVFAHSAVAAEIDAAETHFKESLLTRKFGHNRN